MHLIWGFYITAIIVSSAKTSNADMKRAILHCDSERLTDALLRQMIQYMPDPEKIHKLQELSASDKADLVDAEKFALEVSKKLKMKILISLFNGSLPFRLVELRTSFPS